MIWKPCACFMQFMMFPPTRQFLRNAPFCLVWAVDVLSPLGLSHKRITGKIILTGAVISEDGKQSIRLSAVDEEPHELGERLAQLVLERGAADLLKASV